MSRVRSVSAGKKERRVRKNGWYEQQCEGDFTAGNSESYCRYYRQPPFHPLTTPYTQQHTHIHPDTPTQSPTHTHPYTDTQTLIHTYIPPTPTPNTPTPIQTPIHTHTPHPPPSRHTLPSPLPPHTPAQSCSSRHLSHSSGRRHDLMHHKPREHLPRPPPATHQVPSTPEA